MKALFFKNIPFKKETYSWQCEGEYAVKVKAKDSNNVESDWSDPLPVTMPQKQRILLEKIIE